MTPYQYPPLSPGRDTIRLLRLLPDQDGKADIRCELIEYSLAHSSELTHQYEALFYTWGNPDQTQLIRMHGHGSNVTNNLHAALLRLRDHSVERYLWIDAICIHQANDEEKEHQIQSMARIYGQANRVVVWLGEAADDSDLAIEQIRMTPYSSGNMESRHAMLKLLQRPWFRRSIDAHSFCTGVDVLEDILKANLDLYNLIYPVTFLMRKAAPSSAYPLWYSSKPSLGVCSLGELVDMYHAHEATKRHDKVYALLGMSSDDLSVVNLLPDYKEPWENLLQRLAKYLLGEEISVETYGDKEIAAIKGKGHILGTITSVRRTAFDSGQEVTIAVNDPHLQHENSRMQYWTLRPSAKPIQDGDHVCLLRGGSKPLVVRLFEDHAAIIMVAAVPIGGIRHMGSAVTWTYITQSATSFSLNFLLLWEWRNFPTRNEFPVKYNTLLKNFNRTEDQLGDDKINHLYKANKV